MADSKISALSDGGAILAGDQFVVARSGANVSILGTQFGALLYKSVLGADAASIDTGAGGINGGWNILEIFVIVRTADPATTGGVTVRFNNDSGANYDAQYMDGSGGSTGASGGTGATALTYGGGSTVTVDGNTATAGYATFLKYTVPGYSGTTFFKNVEFYQGSGRGATRDLVLLAVDVWASTAAISRFSIAGATANLKAGSAVYIYGR